MQIKYDVEKMNEIIKNIADLLKISIIVFDSNWQVLSRYSNQHDYCAALQKEPEFKKKCLLSDMTLVEKCKHSGKIEKHICHAGLCDIAMPIVKDKITAAYVVVGRIRLLGSDIAKFSTIDKTEEASRKALTEFSDEQLESLIALLPHIMFGNAIIIMANQKVEKIAEYIRTNPKDDLSVGALCHRFYISKNALYKMFFEEFRCTVNAFVTDARLDEAKRLLICTRKTVMEICDEVGIGNYTYFCKIFKKRCGTTPTKFRRSSISAENSKHT